MRNGPRLVFQNTMAGIIGRSIRPVSNRFLRGPSLRLNLRSFGTVVKEGHRVEIKMVITDPVTNKVIVSTDEQTVSFVVGQGQVCSLISRVVPY